MVTENEPPELGRLHDNSIMWRISSWGGAATVALAAAVLITQTDIGAQRLKTAFSADELPARSVAKVDTKADTKPDNPSSADNNALRLETERLQAQLRDLIADRDRLTARVASLEQNLTDMTGSIKRELASVAATAPSQPPKLSTPTTAPPQTTVVTKTVGTDSAAPDENRAQTPQGQAVIKSDARFVSTADTQPEPRPETKPQSMPASSQERKLEPRLEPKLEPKAEPQHAPPIQAAKAVVEEQSQAAPSSIEAVPLPPLRVAAAPASEPAAAPPHKPGIGVELGGARTMAILNARWIAVKANFGPMLEGMYPLYVHDQRPGVGIPYRLIVGPMPNGAAAAAACARFAASRVTCRATKFAGEQLLQR